MHSYGVKDVEKLLRISRNTIRALISAGFVSPGRGPRNSWRFSFQDLILLRTAQALADARVPARRITRSMRELRKHLPVSMPLSGLSIGAVADRVVVREGAARWQAESGQYLLEFEGDPAKGSLNVIERDWFEKAAALEQDDPDAAIAAYRRGIEADPAHLDARINLGLLLHQRRKYAEAERVYGEALNACGADPVLLFNIGVLLEDLNRRAEAMEAYRAALAGDPDFADAHFNLALLCERAHRPREALRHMAEYRRLAGD